MATQLENLINYEPGLISARILDVGSGKGSFILEATAKGITVSGIEKNQRNIEITMQKGKEQGLVLDLQMGTAESLPYRDDIFDFANLNEVLEHVADPKQALSELHRVMKVGGQAYVSLPNRFGLWDPHFRVYFINWMPRSWARQILAWVKKHKDYSHQDSGFQSLDQMCYLTFGQAIDFFTAAGFRAEDLRVRKIMVIVKNHFLQKACLMVYKLARPWYFATHHYWLTRV